MLTYTLKKTPGHPLYEQLYQNIRDDIAAGRLIELFPQWRPASLPVHLVYPWARYYPTRLRKFLDLMREIMPDLAGMQRPQSA